MLFRGEVLWMGSKSFYIIEDTTAEQAHDALVGQKYRDLKDAFDNPETPVTREDIAAQVYIEPEPIKFEGRVAYIADEKGL